MLRFEIRIARRGKGSYTGTVPAFPEIQVRSRSQAQCRERLRDEIFESVMEHLSRGEPYDDLRISECQPFEANQDYTGYGPIWMDSQSVPDHVGGSRKGIRTKSLCNSEGRCTKDIAQLTLLQSLKTRLRGEMEAKGISEYRLAKLMGVEKQVVNRMLKNKPKNGKKEYEPKVSTFERAFAALGKRLELYPVDLDGEP